MNAWENTVLVGLYTITPLHLGSGQAAGAVDLPIARNAATGFPLIPATSIKGVARETIELAAPDDKAGRQLVANLFGKAIETPTNDTAENGTSQAAPSNAGQLCFSEANLIAYPARSLNRPFLHITCPLILERLQRELRAFDIDFPLDFTPPRDADSVWARVSNARLDNQPLVIEDLMIESDRVVHTDETTELARQLAQLIPDDDQPTRNRLIQGLTILPDTEFSELLSRIVPVRARIQLTGGKTTDKWKNPKTGQIETGNLWYEEHLPSDCLFATFVGARRHWRTSAASPPADDAPSGKPDNPVASLQTYSRQLKYLQLGGDETVGHGVCYWRFSAHPGETS